MEFPDGTSILGIYFSQDPLESNPLLGAKIGVFASGSEPPLTTSYEPMSSGAFFYPEADMAVFEFLFDDSTSPPLRDLVIDLGGDEWLIEIPFTPVPGGNLVPGNLPNRVTFYSDSASELIIGADLGRMSEGGFRQLMGLVPNTGVGETRVEFVFHEEEEEEPPEEPPEEIPEGTPEYSVVEIYFSENPLEDNFLQGKLFGVLVSGGAPVTTDYGPLTSNPFFSPEADMVVFEFDASTMPPMDIFIHPTPGGAVMELPFVLIPGGGVDPNSLPNKVSFFSDSENIAEVSLVTYFEEGGNLLLGDEPTSGGTPTRVEFVFREDEEPPVVTPPEPAPTCSPFWTAFVGTREELDCPSVGTPSAVFSLAFGNSIGASTYSPWMEGRLGTEVIEGVRSDNYSLTQVNGSPLFPPRMRTSSTVLDFLTPSAGSFVEDIPSLQFRFGPAPIPPEEFPRWREEVSFVGEPSGATTPVQGVTSGSSVVSFLTGPKWPYRPNNNGGTSNNEEFYLGVSFSNAEVFLGLPSPPDGRYLVLFDLAWVVPDFYPNRTDWILRQGVVAGELGVISPVDSDVYGPVISELPADEVGRVCVAPLRLRGMEDEFTYPSYEAARAAINDPILSAATPQTLPFSEMVVALRPVGVATAGTWPPNVVKPLVGERFYVTSIVGQRVDI